MNFEWQTADEESSGNGAGVPESGRRRRLPLLLLLLTAIVGGIMLWREADQRVTGAEAEAVEGVQASHGLAQQAADAGDEEVFRSLLSGRNEAWWKAQQEALAERRLFGRAALPLGVSPQGAPQIRAVELDPELRECVVVARQDYVVTGTARVRGTLTLERHYVYRKGRRQWLYSPPLPEFWGGTRQEAGRTVSLAYRERDADLGRRLAEDLERIAGDFCALPGVSCHGRLPLQAELGTGPESVGILSSVRLAASGEEVLSLPSPTLIGIPTNEAGYELLLQSYATLVLARLLARATGYDCCQNSSLFSALLLKQMSRLELTAWPLGPAEYETLLAQGVDPLTVRGRMQRDHPGLPLSQQGESWWYNLALVDFLEAEVGAERLLDAGYNVYRFWLERHGQEAERFADAWLAFIYEHSRSAQMQGPPLPESALHFGCREFGSGDQYLLAYDFREEAWSERIRVSPPASEASDHGYANVIALPGEYGYVILDLVYAPQGAQETGRIRWRPGPAVAAGPAGEPIPIVAWTRARGEEEALAYATSHAPSGRYLVVAGYAVSVRMPVAWLIDLQRCRAGDCARRPLVGRPIWSPDGRQTLLVGHKPGEGWAAAAHPTLYRGDERGENARPVGAGYNPFWIDETRYGYVRAGEAGRGQELVVATTRAERKQVVARTAQFLEVIVGETRPERLSLESVVAMGTNSGQLLVRARDNRAGEGGGTYLFSLVLDGAGRGTQIRLRFASTQNTFAAPSPSGRWLLVQAFEADGMVTTWLLDLEEDSVMSLGTVRGSMWAPSGRWLVQVYERYFLLRTPAEGYKRPVIRDLAGCQPHTWTAGG